MTKKYAMIGFIISLFITSSYAFSIPDNLAIRAIIGESANQGFIGQLAVAGALRNRGNLNGVYGLNSKMVDNQPQWVWKQAAKAWAESATNDITGGAKFWENTKQFGTPYWAKHMKKTVLIKDHQFFK